MSRQQISVIKFKFNKERNTLRPICARLIIFYFGDAGSNPAGAVNF